MRSDFPFADISNPYKKVAVQKNRIMFIKEMRDKHPSLCLKECKDILDAAMDMGKDYFLDEVHKGIVVEAQGKDLFTYLFDVLQSFYNSIDNSLKVEVQMPLWKAGKIARLLGKLTKVVGQIHRELSDTRHASYEHD